MRRIAIRVALVLAAMIALLAILVGVLFPWRRVSGVRIENARIIDAKMTDRGGQPTSRALAITFSTTQDLVKLRSDIDIGYIAADIFACDDPAATNREVVTQRAEYLAERGRAKALGHFGIGNDLRYRYEVIYDDELTRSGHDTLQIERAIGHPGGLCFALDGASMWAGKLWSNRVPVRLAPTPPA